MLFFIHCIINVPPLYVSSNVCSDFITLVEIRVVFVQMDFYCIPLRITAIIKSHNAFTYCWPEVTYSGVWLYAQKKHYVFNLKNLK